jgi:hypothetical protein
MINKRHALYRFYDAQDRLLYIGITVSVLSRWGGHERDKPWWGDVVRATITHFPNRAKVLEQEKAAIIMEKPLYNKHHNKGNSTVPEMSPENEALAATLTAGADGSHGDVVAIATPNGCPVGLITTIDELGVRLSLMSFLTGGFGHTHSVVFWRDVKGIQVARRRTEDEPAYGGGSVSIRQINKWDGCPGRQWYETEPLGEFQTRWNDQLKAKGIPIL